MRTTDIDRITRLLGAWDDGGHGAAALHVAVRELVVGGYLPAGTRMPGQRDLAAAIGVARGTVATAYAQLVAAGHLVARRGSGTFVRSGRGHREPDARLTSFDDDAGPDAVDLTSGALPGSELVARVMPEVGRLLLEHHLAGTGYHPGGFPGLRSALADRLTADGIPTTADDLLVTAGAQQGVWLLASALAGPGSTVVVEDPTYRGALEAFADSGARVLGVPFTSSGLDTDLLRQVVPGADVLYVQTSVHNPTGFHTPAPRRREIARIAAESDLLVIDDQSSADLPWTRTGRMPGLEQFVDPERLVVVGTLSKLFWGGLRVGWVRAPRGLVSRLTELRRGTDLAGSMADQLAATLLLPHVAEQRATRRAGLTTRFDEVTQVLARAAPGWTWWLPSGGSGLWVDTHDDAVALARRARADGVRLTAGPVFSPYSAHRSFLRLPVWVDADVLARAVAAVVRP